MIYRLFSPSRDIKMTTPFPTEADAIKAQDALNRAYPGEPDWQYVEEPA